MSRILYLFIIIFLTVEVLDGQHFSKDITLSLVKKDKNTWVQTISFSKPHWNDFAAVSLVIEGTNLNQDDIKCSLTTTKKTHDFVPFGEDPIQQDRFVSDIIYLSPEENNDIILTIISEIGADISELTGRVHIFIPESDFLEKGGSNHIDKQGRSIGCECPKPSFTPRVEWGASFGLTGQIFKPPASYTNVTHLIVHHSAGTNVSNNWKGVVASVFDLHVSVNGWQDIGYNWLIDPNGVIYEGRGGGDNVIGAHMCGYNSHTMGVCVLGNFVSEEPANNSLKALVELLSWKSCNESISPTGSSVIPSYKGFMDHISGHQDGCSPNYTTCPGDKLYTKLDSLRTAVESNIKSNCSKRSSTLLPLYINIVPFPNPAFDKIRLVFGENPDLNGEIQIVDALGHQYLTKFLNRDNEGDWVNIYDLESGFYWITFRNNRHIGISKFLKM
jgi:hypothetical protein